MKKNSILCSIILSLLLMLTAGCTAAQTESPNVDKTAFKAVKGDYRVVETDTVDGWWHLFIGTTDDIPCYFTIYDISAGNPGVSGEITTMNDSSLTIKIDPDLFEALPADWNLSGNDSELTMDYTCSDDNITLTNNGLPVVFEREAE
ncbi:MAG: hypothetical protein PUG60_12385 [Lachnospiraceae bacterium]|nr:hypothetical protein [Lachnospiraceae bacterium]MDY4970434.1 hypothetical protein [Lachnospiraceae bacterium]